MPTRPLVGAPVTSASLKVGDQITAVSLDGQKVYKNHTVARILTSGNVEVIGDSGYGSLYTIDKPNTGWVLVRFTRKMPEYWPPVPGDVWNIESTDYFFGTDAAVTSGVRSSGTAGRYTAKTVTDAVTEYGSAGTLVYRKGVKVS